MSHPSTRDCKRTAKKKLAHKIERKKSFFFFFSKIGSSLNKICVEKSKGDVQQFPPFFCLVFFISRLGFVEFRLMRHSYVIHVVGVLGCDSSFDC